MPNGTMHEYMGNKDGLREMRIPGFGAITIPDYTWNQPAKMTFPGGIRRTYGYDALMRLQSLAVTDPAGNPVLDYAYTYDNVGNIETKTSKHGTYTYDYDDSSRLTGVDNPVLDDESYTYDDVGNRLTAADVSGTWDYNANNELLGFADVEYEYDDNGNMTQIKVVGEVVWTYVYDAANRLVHVEDGTGTISADYYYDPFGRRLWKEVGGTRTYFFYSEEGVIAEYDENGTEIKSYGYKPDSTWTTDPLFQKVGSTYYWYQNDHLGTPQKLVAQDGTVVWSAQYTAFGEADIQVETVTNNLHFPGQYADAETGLHYNFQRYYDPRIGRYLRKDPIGFDGEDVNLYGYSGNNPLKKVDSLGLKWTISREFGSQAEAIVCDDTVEELAKIIGLSAQDYRKWLEPAYYSGPRFLPASPSEKMDYRTFYIPNTVYAYWAGHLSWFGRWHVSWNESISYLRRLGFLVMEDRHVHGMGTYLENEVVQLSNVKALHGLYFWGHGSPDYGLSVAQKNMFGLIKQSSWEDVLVYARASGSLLYKMALSLMFACFSNTGKKDLFSNAPGGIWHGYDKILKPIFGNYHVEHWVHPGDQATRTAM